MAAEHPYFFGYGSLVNRATHDFPGARVAELVGWRRTWRHTDLRPVAFLTAVRDPSTTIEGLIAQVPHDDWDALDQREWAYDRIPAKDEVRHSLAYDPDIAVYAVSDDKQKDGSSEHPVLLSYIDVVVQGYLREFGEDGARRFFETTSGWETPILNDRTEPRYPRHQQLERWQSDFVDASLNALGVRFVSAEA